MIRAGADVCARPAAYAPQPMHSADMPPPTDGRLRAAMFKKGPRACRRMHRPEVGPLTHRALRRRAGTNDMNPPEAAFMAVFERECDRRGWSLYPQVSMPYYTDLPLRRPRSRHFISDFILVMTPGYDLDEALPPAGVLALELDGRTWHEGREAIDAARDAKIKRWHGIETWRGPSAPAMSWAGVEVYASLFRRIQSHLAIHAEELRRHAAAPRRQVLAADLVARRLYKAAESAFDTRSAVLNFKVLVAAPHEWHAARAAAVRHGALALTPPPPRPPSPYPGAKATRDLLGAEQSIRADDGIVQGDYKLNTPRFFSQIRNDRN